MARENIDVTVELHDRLSLPAERAEHAVDDLGDEVRELNVNLAATEAAASRYERAMAAVRRASGRTRRDIDDTSESGKRFDIVARLMKSGGDSIFNGFTRAGAGAKGFARMLKFLKISALIMGIVAAVSMLVSALSALSAAAFAGVAGLSPLVGLLGAVPALVAPLIGAFAAVKLGFLGVGDALKVMADGSKSIQEQAAAMQGLTPEARELVYTLMGAKKATEGWSRSIQQSMLPYFTASVERLSGLFPTIEQGLTRTGKQVGILAYAVSDELASSGKDVERIFNRSNRLIRYGLTPSAVAFVSIWTDFAVAGGPLAERFARWLGVSATNLADLVEEGRKSGRLTEFLNRAGDLAAGVGRVFGDVSVALFNIGKQSDVLSGRMGRGVLGLATDFREWTESTTGRNTVRQWFEDVQPALEQTVRLMGGLATTFANLGASHELAELLRTVNDDLVPALGRLGEVSTEEIGQALVIGLTAVVDLLSTLGQSPVPEFLLGLAEAAGVVADVFTAIPGPLQSIIMGLIALKGLSVALAFVMPRLAGAVSPVTRAFGEVRAGMQLYSEGLRGLPAATGAARGALVGLRSAAAGGLAALGGPWGIAIMAGVTALGVFSAKSAKTRAEVDALRESFDEQTGAITENTRALIAKKLEDEGALAAAQKLGIDLKTVTDATMGNADATERLRLIHQAWVDTVKRNGDVSQQQYEDAYAQWDIWQTLIGAMGEGTFLLDEATSSEKRLSAAMGESTGQTVLSADALQRQADAANRSRRAVIALNDTLVSQQRTLIGFRQAIENSEKTLVEGARTLDLHTQAGRDNRSALLDVAEAAAAVENKAQRTKAIKEARQFIEDWADSAGWGATKAQNYADKLFNLGDAAKKLPKDSEVVVHVTGYDEAMRQLIAINNAARTQALSIALGDPTLARPGRPGRRDGGAVWTGADFTIGEVGAELFVGASGRVSAIGEGGQATMRFSEPGYVLPNEFYEAARAAAEPPPPIAMATPVTPYAPEPRERHDAPSAPLPPVTVVMPASGHQLTEADVEAAAMRAYRRFKREQEERR